MSGLRPGIYSALQDRTSRFLLHENKYVTHSNGLCLSHMEDAKIHDS